MADVAGVTPVHPSIFVAAAAAAVNFCQVTAGGVGRHHTRHHRSSEWQRSLALATPLQGSVHHRVVMGRLPGKKNGATIVAMVAPTQCCAAPSSCVERVRG